MDRRTAAPLRIAWIGAAHDGVWKALEALHGSGPVRAFGDLYGEVAALTEFEPRLVFLRHRKGTLEQDLGAVRMLRGLLPELTSVLVTGDGDLSRDQRRACDAADVVPFDPDRDLPHLGALVARAREGGVAAADYLQFVQGICDEINNPLMFASGHLQLLRSGLDPEQDGERLNQVEAVRSGLVRIETTMRKVAAMGRASRRRRESRTFPLAELVDATTAGLAARSLEAEIRCASRERAMRVDGDLELLAGALCDLSEVGVELATRPPVALCFRPGTTSLACDMRVTNPRLESWELPRAFEPYQLNEVLRGTSAGLNLFLVRLVAEAHGWSAVARRTEPRTVEFCIGAAPLGGVPN